MKEEGDKTNKADLVETVKTSFSLWMI